jgi:hypothetical protein
MDGMICIPFLFLSSLDLFWFFLSVMVQTLLRKKTNVVVYSVFMALIGDMAFVCAVP